MEDAITGCEWSPKYLHPPQTVQKSPAGFYQNAKEVEETLTSL